MHRDLAYGTVEPGNLFDLYVPDVAGESLLPLIIWHSGSGWFKNDAKDRVDDRAEVVEELTQRGFAVASINVRSSTDPRFPAQGFDARSAIRYLRKNAATARRRPRPICVHGRFIRRVGDCVRSDDQRHP